MSITVTTGDVESSEGKRGYTTTQAARILRRNRDEIYDLISNNRLKWASNPGTGAIIIFLDEPARPAPGPKPSPPKAREKREGMTERKPPTKKQSAWLADMGSPVGVLPGRMRPIREPEPEPMWVEFPPPLPSLIPDGWMSLREAAGLLRVSIGNVKDWILDDRLESMLCLGRTLVSRNSVRKHMEQFE